MSLRHFHPRIATPVLSGRLRVLADRLDAIRTGQAPTTADLARAPRLRDYQLAQSPVGPVLLGEVIAHPHCGPGLVHTSPVWVLDPEGAWALTLSRFYVLEPSAGPHGRAQEVFQ